MVIRNHSADRPSCFLFTNSLVIPVDLDRSAIVMDEKGSLGANHAGVCMVVKLGTAFIWIVVAVRAPSLAICMAATAR